MTASSSGSHHAGRWCAAPPSRRVHPRWAVGYRRRRQFRCYGLGLTKSPLAASPPDLLAYGEAVRLTQCIVLTVSAHTIPVGSAPTPSDWERSPLTAVVIGRRHAMAARIGVGSPAQLDGRRRRKADSTWLCVRSVPGHSAGNRLEGAGAVEHFAPALPRGPMVGGASFTQADDQSSETGLAAEESPCDDTFGLKVTDAVEYVPEPGWLRSRPTGAGSSSVVAWMADRPSRTLQTVRSHHTFSRCRQSGQGRSRPRNTSCALVVTATPY